jgi:hypothetical protein
MENLTECFECGVETEFYDIEDKIIERGYHHDHHCPFYEPNTCGVCDTVIEDYDGAECQECCEF